MPPPNVYAAVKKYNYEKTKKTNMLYFTCNKSSREPMLENDIVLTLRKCIWVNNISTKHENKLKLFFSKEN